MLDEARAPAFVFFRHAPTDLVGRPPLASSLQTFESCLLLLTAGRYPHALAACAFAIEGALKAGLNVEASDRINLQALLERALQRAPGLQSFDRGDLKALRDTRNQIVHYGYSPHDDEHIAGLLLQIGVPFLEACYKVFFDFSLEDGLISEVSSHLRISRQVFASARKAGLAELAYCLRALSHAVRWRTRDIAWWEAEALEATDTNGLRFQLTQARKDHLERVLDPSWALDCPVCDTVESFVCELDKQALHESRVQLIRAACIDCELTIPAECPFLADALCREQLEAKKRTILREYGLPE